MDPITMAIVAAVTTGVAGGAGKLAEKAVVDAYTSLKDLLLQKFGADSKVVKAAQDVEENPQSKSRPATLNEEISTAKADQDPELLSAARALLDLVKAQPGGSQIVQQATGSNIAQAADGSSASVNVNSPKG